jgi:hypothetical protein
LTPYVDTRFFPTLQSLLFPFSHPCRPVGAFFTFSLFSRFLHLFASFLPIFTIFRVFILSTFALFHFPSLLRPIRDFLLLLCFCHHIAYLGSPCTLGCNPVVHASWAVAGWVTNGYVPAKWVVEVVGVWRRWRSFNISSAVRVVVCGGGCGSGGGGVVCPIC